MAKFRILQFHLHKWGCPKSRNAGNPETWKPGNPETRKLGNPEFRNDGMTETRKTSPRILKPGMTTSVQAGLLKFAYIIAYIF